MWEAFYFNSLSRALCFCCLKLLLLMFSLLGKAVFHLVIVSGTIQSQEKQNYLTKTQPASVEGQVTMDLAYCLRIESSSGSSLMEYWK